MLAADHKTMSDKPDVLGPLLTFSSPHVLTISSTGTEAPQVAILYTCPLITINSCVRPWSTFGRPSYVLDSIYARSWMPTLCRTISKQDTSSAMPNADCTLSPSSPNHRAQIKGRERGQRNVHSLSTRPARLIQTSNLFIYLPLDYQLDSTLFCEPSF